MHDIHLELFAVVVLAQFFWISGRKKKRRLWSGKAWALAFLLHRGLLWLPGGHSHSRQVMEIYLEVKDPQSTRLLFVVMNGEAGEEGDGDFSVRKKRGSEEDWLKTVAYGLPRQVLNGSRPWLGSDTLQLAYYRTTNFTMGSVLFLVVIAL